MARIATLVEEAERKGLASASNGRWFAVHSPESGTVVVTHHRTAMISVDVRNRTVTALNAGWGSQTDKQGINAILRHERIEGSYWSLFG
jgi:hypothetical protein